MAGTRSLKVRPDAHVAQLLVEGRRKRKLSLQVVSEATRLPVSQIESLESGDFSVFAAEVYGRGAYLAYARYLGISQRLAERAVDQALSAARQRVPLKVFTPFSWMQRFLTPLTLLWLIGAVVGLTAAGYLVWQLQSFLQLPELALIEPAGVVVGTPELFVHGVAEANSRVTVNGEVVLLGENGEFSTRLWLHPGVNILRVEAENAAGRVRTLEKHLILPRA